MTPWKINITHIQQWLSQLPENQYEDVLAAIIYLSEVGPNGSRPFIDRIHHGKYHHFKELRPRDSAKNIRIIFAFDPTQQAIMLIAGDKTNQWQRWYKKAIPQAEKIYQEHLKQIGHEKQ